MLFRLRSPRAPVLLVVSLEPAAAFRVGLEADVTGDLLTPQAPRLLDPVPLLALGLDPRFRGGLLRSLRRDRLVPIDGHDEAAALQRLQIPPAESVDALAPLQS